MIKEFVPYQEALEMKALGFDEPCFGRYNVPGEFILSGCYSDSPLISILVEQNDICESHTLAPTFSQAFRWFRKKHNLDGVVEGRGYEYKRYYIYTINGKWHPSQPALDSYEEAELACLRKLIELSSLTK